MPYGSTSEEVERALGMLHQTVSARRTDLRASGYTDYLRDALGVRMKRPTRTNNGAYVQVATPKGLAVIRDKLPLHLKGRDPTESHHGGDPMSSQAFNFTSRYSDCYRILEHMCKFS